MVLTRTQAREFYNRFGERQDAQSWYEDAALDELCANGNFGEATSVVEFGCGTGRFAKRLLSEVLPSNATYRGLDQSSTMVALTRRRLASFEDRVKVELSDGSILLGEPASVSHVVSTYVLDLLAEKDIGDFLTESHRVLIPGGRVCLAGLAWGPTILSSVVSAFWNLIWKLRPVVVGGCRPMDLRPFLSSRYWELELAKTVVVRGLASQAVVAKRTSGSGLPAPGLEDGG